MFRSPLPDFLRGRPRPVTIPAIRLSGVIGSVGLGGRGLSLASIERAIDAAFAHKRAPAVALLINSPGGSPVQSALIAGRIRALADEKQLPVLAFVEDVAASGRLLAGLCRRRDLRRPVLDRGLDRRGQRRLRLPGGHRQARHRAAGAHHRRAQGAARPVPRRAAGRSRGAAPDPGRHPGALRRACARPAGRPAQGRGCRAVRRQGLDRRCGAAGRA